MRPAIVVALCVAHVGCAAAPPPRDAISAAELAREFQVNPGEADRTWRGRTVTVSGRVASIYRSDDEEGSDLLYVRLAGESRLSAAICQMSGAKSAAAFQKGRDVRIRGRVVGALTLGVLLEDCVAP